jgi:hypothetical protein
MLPSNGTPVISEIRCQMEALATPTDSRYGWSLEKVVVSRRIILSVSRGILLTDEHA